MHFLHKVGKAARGIKHRPCGIGVHQRPDAIVLLTLANDIKQIVAQPIGSLLVAQVEVEHEYCVLCPLLLQLHNPQSLEQVSAALEVIFQGAHQEALAEAARTAEEIDVAAGKFKYEVGLVHIDIAAFTDGGEVLYANRIVQHDDDFLFFRHKITKKPRKNQGKSRKPLSVMPSTRQK